MRRDGDDVVARIASRAVAKRSATYADEVRRLLDAGLEVMRRCGTASRPAGQPTSSRPPGCRTRPSTGTSRRRTRWSRPSSRTAPSGSAATSPTRWSGRTTPEGKVRRWVEGVLSQAADDDIAGDHPRRALERREPGQRPHLRPAARHRAAGRRCCGSRSPSSAAPTPSSTRRWPPTRPSACWPTGCGSGPRPTPAEIDRVVAFCLAGRAEDSLGSGRQNPSSSAAAPPAPAMSAMRSPVTPEQVVVDAEGLVERPLAGSPTARRDRRR